MLLALELQAGQLQCAMQADGAGQLARPGEGLLEVQVWRVTEQAAQIMLLPLAQQLAAVVIAPAAPADQARGMLAQPALELRPDLRQRRGGVDVVLGDMGQLTAKSVRQGRRCGRMKR